MKIKKSIVNDCCLPEDITSYRNRAAGFDLKWFEGIFCYLCTFNLLFNR